MAFRLQKWSYKETFATIFTTAGLAILAVFYFGGFEIMPSHVQEVLHGHGYETCSRMGWSGWQCDKVGDSNSDGLCFDPALRPKTFDIEKLRDLARGSGESCLVVKRSGNTYWIWEVNGPVVDSHLGFLPYEYKKERRGSWTYHWYKDDNVI